jgi:hypothetical protein
MEIIQQIISKELQTGLPLAPKYFTVHETDNESKTADAKAHANLQSRGNDRNASWHFQADDKQIIQSVPDNVVAFAAGDGGNGPGNRTSLHGEICVNSGGDYKKAVENMAYLARVKTVEHNIPLANIVQHNKWSGKDCPHHLRKGDWGITWPQFLGMCKGNQTGWVKEAGQWYYYAGGIKKSGWLLDGGKWYYLNASGVMQTGWGKVNTKWYYLDGSGAMKTGWVKVDGKWYYLESSGAMKTGWLKDTGKWYYLDGSGAMVTGWICIGGTWYFFNAAGDMASGKKLGANITVNSDGSISKIE